MSVPNDLNYDETSIEEQADLNKKIIIPANTNVEQKLSGTDTNEVTEPRESSQRYFYQRSNATLLVTDQFSICSLQK